MTIAVRIRKDGRTIIDTLRIDQEIIGIYFYRNRNEVIVQWVGGYKAWQNADSFTVTNEDS